MRLTPTEIARRTRGRIVGAAVNHGGDAFGGEGASIDSRTVAPGEAFFAVRGEFHDGHRFVADAAARGASCVVVSDESAASGMSRQVPVVVVEDTLRALQDLAASMRSEMRAIACGISGSAGKTTTKDLAHLLLSGELRSHATPGNLNNHYGLPLAILRAPADAEALVLELGISTPGEMDRLVEIAAPDFGLLTVISAVHVGNFGTFAELCEEKMKLARGSRRALLNSDDPEQVSRRTTVPAAITWFGEDDGADSGLRLTNVASRGLLGSRVTLEERGARYDVELPLAGRHQARNLLAAAALARAAGVSWDAIASQAAKAEAGKHRGQVLHVGGAVIVDDTYNANPLAMRMALALLCEAVVAPAGRRIFVAGDMLELGAIGADEHRALGAHAAPLVDVLAAVGPDARHVAEGARSAGRDAVLFADAEAAGQWLRQTLRDGDVALVKGSRGIGLDRAIDLLRSSRGAEARPVGAAGNGDAS